MARVQEVVLRKTPPGPGEYGTKMDALEANPEEVVVDARFSRRKSVEDAAFRVNSGKRRDWPNDRFYACWDFNAEGVGATEDEGPVATMGRWELLIGDKRYMPEVWRPIVEAPGSRRRRRQADTAPQVEESYEDAA
jgi:hypothetical protein